MRSQLKNKVDSETSVPGKEWWREGVRFQCQGSGKCCTSHGEFGFVFMTLEDRKRMAKVLNMRVSEFTKKHCQKAGGIYHLIEVKGQPDCKFLEGVRCGVYEGRPTQCRTWPFWPEVMSPKAWKKDVVEFCPGVGKGPLIPAEEIERILNEQAKSENGFGT
ncbi:MAG: YkgJ family cysteine cluster protein [Bdellovibrionaceae bacterium]|nr:YkgJ family cysteine cluster protein [Pseudobdellovibrionaceae bacterium]